MPRAVDLRLDAIELAQDRRVLTALLRWAAATRSRWPSQRGLGAFVGGRIEEETKRNSRVLPPATAAQETLRPPRRAGFPYRARAETC
jgi:hypothetical protein